jgi:hypothetical protein
MTVNSYAFSDAILDALFASLSPERMSSYTSVAGADREKAVRLYTWNTAVSAAFYGPLQGLEVALRNALHRALSAIYGLTWYDNPACQFDWGTQRRISEAKQKLKDGGYAVDPPHVVAELSFGFWVAILGKGGKVGPQDSRKRNYEMALWRPALHKAFPHAKQSRVMTHQPLDYLRTFRNRIAHHEPIFTRHLAADYQSILTVAGWICPHTRDWIAHHSRVTELLATSPDEASIRF